jgi:Destabilase
MISLVLCIVVASSETGYLIPVFEAIRSVETGGMAQPRDAVGDVGRSIGPYQISRAYWADSGVRGDWKWCKDRAYAEAVVLAFWKRYCPEALRRGDIETLVRVHNGGPQGHRKAATLPYWKKIQVRVTQNPRAHLAHRRAGGIPC